MILQFLTFALFGCSSCNVFWVIRMCTLAHWCYLVGVYSYPDEAYKRFMVASILFGIFLVGCTFPDPVLPGFRDAMSILSLFPQLHVMVLLNSVRKNLVQQEEEKLAPAVLTTTTDKAAAPIPKPVEPVEPPAAAAAETPDTDNEPMTSKMALDELSTKTLVNTVKAYSAITFVSIAFTIYNILWGD